MDISSSPNPTDSPHISDELLSAYIDEAVNEEERRLIEAALHSDAETAWRLNALRQTVYMLRALPQVKLPRAYSLTALLAAEQAAIAGAPGGATPEPVGGRVRPAAAPAPRTTEPALRRGFWEALGAFFGSGNMALRNSAAAAFTLFVVLLVGGQAVTGSPLAMESSAAPAAPAAQMVTVADSAAGDSAAADSAAADSADIAAVAAAPAAASAARTAIDSAEEPVGGGAALADTAPVAEASAADAPAAMMAAAPASVAAATDNAARATAISAAAAPLMGEGMGGEGMGGGPAAAPAPIYPDVAGGAEAITGLDMAMAEEGAMDTGARARPAPVAAAAAAAPAVEAAPANAASAASLATSPPAAASAAAAPMTDTTAVAHATTATTTTVAAAKAAPRDIAPADVAATPAVAQTAAAGNGEAIAAAPAAAAAAEPSFAPGAAPDGFSSSRAWGVEWLTLAAWALGALTLLLVLLWLLSRGRASNHA